MDKNLQVHIIGGSGAMGSWLRNFLESFKLSVSVSDKESKPQDLEKKDIIFVSVPIKIAPEIILETAKKTRKNCLIVDVSSVKSETINALKNCGRNALSLHFLFGPQISSIKNQKIVFQNLGSSKNSKELLKLFEEEGAQIIEMNGKDHDFKMAHIQSLTHFINLALAQILIDNKIGIKGEVSTPIFLSQLSSMLRVLSQNPRLISEIQTLNPEFVNVLEDFLNIQKEMIKKIKNKEIQDLEKQFDSLRKNLESFSNQSKKPPEIKNSKTDIKNLKIGCLGPEGTFSNQAVLKLFDDSRNKIIYAENIYALFEDLENGGTDLIVAPAENTIEGTVRETLDLLLDTNTRIIGKIDLEISQCLLSKGKNLREIKKVISHPQAVNQSRNFLEQNLPNAVIETSSSTLAGLKDLEDPTVAIIGSELAGKIYKLNILKKNIQNSENNVTRFYIISKKDILNLKKRTKSLLFLSVFNRVGILRDILSIFADLSINLNKIESRPSKEKNWDYYFYVEIELTEEDPRFNQALNILKQYCPDITVLGML